ncbi:MAG: class I SAM-dependent DNA methyltransferase, partial [candidate division Zixibacteria bacterium]|nr:class I SAM-dependent DNA methyltransferase [candidate division Zixibacteria bacterium]
MDTSKLKTFAQYARRNLIEQVSSKLTRVLAKDSPARRENPKAVDELERQIKANSKEQVIEKIAYIWFNRFCAFRFMDINSYTSIGVLSPVSDQTQPEILAEAKMGVMDEAIIPKETQRKVTQLLNGTTPSNDPQNEAYRSLIVAVCNYYNKAMPFLFERIADYTELLMPDDLLSGKSILAYTREALTPDMCEDVEVIGWLYQFYISEK